MSNRRPFSNNNLDLDFNSYYSKKNSITNYNFARLHNANDNNNINVNFSMKQCINNNPNNCNFKKIVYYKSYDTLINLSKISHLLDPSCNDCISDVPINLNNGIKSEIKNNELYESQCISSEDIFCEDTSLCDKIPIINNCHEKSGKMFPYGIFNNSIKNKNQPIKIHSLTKINCECSEKTYCPSSYIKCKCDITCNCCIFTTTTPLDKNTNINYTENNNINDDFLDSNILPFKQENIQKIKELNEINLQKDKLLSEKALNIYSKFGNR